MYIYGKKSTLVNDHQPLEFLFSKGGSQSQTRIERWTMRLQEYDFTLCFKSGSHDPACNHLSRDSMQFAKATSIAREYVKFIASNAFPQPITRDEARDETNEDFNHAKAQRMHAQWKVLHAKSKQKEIQGNHYICKDLTSTEGALRYRRWYGSKGNKDSNANSS